MQQRDRFKFHFLIVEKITFLYLIITLLIVLLFGIPYREMVPIIATRVVVATMILFYSYLSNYWKSNVLTLIRYFSLGYLLSVWYPETFDFNRFFENRDYLIAGLEQKLFETQPAFNFHVLFPQRWFSELMNLGYLSYYPIMIFSSIYFYITNKNNFKYFFFVVLASFYTFYLIYILFPTAGPQYYFCTIGDDYVQNGVFPKLYEYFNMHSNLNCVQKSNGFFLNLVEFTQLAGERPTAAFPSSHVGISTIILFVFIEKRKYLAIACLIPFYITLVSATVYIQAHYLVDVFAGMLSATLFYFSARFIYNKFHLNLYDDSILKTE